MANDVRVDVELDTKQAEQDAQTFKGKIAGVFGEMGKIAGGIFMAQLGGSIADKGVDTLKNSIGLARDLNEIQSKANTIFGESSRSINDWAGNAAVGFGQSKAQALDAAATFGNMFSQLGMGSGVTADMSQKMVELASDFASFHNADITQVLEAQQAAFRGEYDAVQRFVPTINAAAVEMKALEQTGKESTKELTAQEKAVAAYALMMEGAGAAMGDFDRTSGSLSNQQRILSAQWQNLQADIGQALIPALTAIVTTINTQVVPAVRAFAQDVKKYWESDIKPAIENMKDAWASVAPVVKPILEAVGAYIRMVATVLTEVVSFVVNILGGDFKGAWEDAKDIVRAAKDGILDQLRGLWEAVENFIPLALQAGKDMMLGLRDGLLEIVDLWIWPFFQNLPRNIVNLIGDLGSVLLQAGKDLMQGFIDGIQSMLGAVGDALGKVPGAGAVGAIGGFASSALPQMAGGGGGGGIAAVPSGAYGQNLVWDSGANAWVYPWEVGQFGTGPRTPFYGTDLVHDTAIRAWEAGNGPYPTYTGGREAQTTHVTIQIDGATIAEAVAQHEARAY